MNLNCDTILLNNTSQYYKIMNECAILAIQNMKKVKNFDKEEVSLLVIADSNHCSNYLSLHKNNVFI